MPQTELNKIGFVDNILAELEFTGLMEKLVKFYMLFYVGGEIRQL